MKSLYLGASLLAFLPAAAHAEDAPPADQNVIVVTASPFGHGRDDTPAITAHVDAQAILSKGGASLADALSDVPGIASTGFATGASRPIIRGMDATRVRMLEDGTSSSDVSDIGPDHGVPLDPLAARSIEVIRGAGTLRYGSQAIGGVVNAINNRVPLALPDRLSGEVTASYGSSGDTAQGSALVDARAGNLALHADGFIRHAGDYDTPLGTQANSFFHGHGASAGASYFPGGGTSRIGLAVTQYNADYGVPSDVTYITMKQTKLITRSLFDLGNGLLQTLKIDGSYGTYQHQEKNPDGTVNATFRNKEWDGRAELLLGRLGPIQNSAIGVEYQHRAFSALGDAASYLLPTVTQNLAGYLFLDSKLSHTLHAELSGRVEHLTEQGTPLNGTLTTRGYTPLSAALGLLWQPVTAVKLGLTASTTARAPAITELYARGPHDGPQTYETGNPTLTPERAHALELSLRIRTGRLRLDGSVYANWFKGYIYGDLTGRTCTSDGLCAGGDLRELNYRQQNARFRGIEGTAGFDLIHADSHTLTLKAFGDVTRATLASGANVPRIPPWRIGGGLDWQSDPLDAGLTVTRVAAQNDPGAFDTATPGYTTLDAHVALRPFKANRGIELVLSGQNLTNAAERNAAALNKDLVIAPGRSVRLALKVSA
ncbi:MAG: TonB-dependent receptor [Sphingomonadales bacterium]|nr:TonB-dependent receptor [Sphingomonadales bacterium]